MAEKIPFRLPVARAETDTRAKCYGDPELFKPWEEMSDKAKAEIKKNGPIPCEGGGTPGHWCEDCRFGKVEAPNWI